MDKLTRLILEDSVMVTACDTTELVACARDLHNTYPTSTAVLGRALTAGVMMGCRLKEKEQRLTININGNGPAGTVIVTAGGDGTVKGCIGEPHVDIPAKADGQLDVGGAVGRDGMLTVIRDEGMKEPYIGRTKLVTGEIGEDLAAYFLYSEQQPSIVYLSVWVDIDTTVLKAGGLIISPLPNASEETISAIEGRLAQIENYALMIMNLTPEKAVEKIFKGMKTEALSTIEPKYLCDCSDERLEQVVISLGEDQLRELISEGKDEEIVCRFCGKKYVFTTERLKELLRKATVHD